MKEKGVSRLTSRQSQSHSPNDAIQFLLNPLYLSLIKRPLLPPSFLPRTQDPFQRTQNRHTVLQNTILLRQQLNRRKLRGSLLARSLYRPQQGLRHIFKLIKRFRNLERVAGGRGANPLTIVVAFRDDGRCELENCDDCARNAYRVHRNRKGCDALIELVALVDVAVR